MSYQLKIGTTSYQAEIQDTDTWSQTVVRDFREKLLRIRGNYSFKAWNALYDVLYTDTVANGVCSSLTGKIFFKPCNSDYEQVWEGQLKAQDGEFDLIKGSVDHQVLDNSWSADFNNSQEQDVYIRTDKSNNETSITPTPYSECSFFNPTDISYYGDTRRCFRVFDVFTFLVAYYSNDAITFTSDYYNTGSGAQYHITTGRELRLHDGTVNPELSFKTLFSEMNKKHDLWIIVEGTYESPVIRIEPRTYALDEDIVIDVEDPESIVMKTDLDQLYSVISIGSDSTAFDVSNDASYPDAYFEAWRSETYNSSGDCQFENSSLDLISDFKIDSNSIEQALKGNDDFDDDIFLVEIDTSTLNADIFTNQFTTDSTDLDGFYNGNLINSVVIDNWFDSLPSVISKALSEDYYCYVDTYSSPGEAGTFDAILYTNDTAPPASDVFNIYTTPTEGGANQGLFVAPVTGYYIFNGQVNVSNCTASRIFRHRVRVWEDNTLTGIGLASYYGPVNSGATSYGLTINEEVYMEGGWVARAEVFQNIAAGFDVDAAHMEVTGPPKEIVDGTNNPLVYLYDIQKFKLSKTNYDLITANKEKRIRFKDTKTGREWKVWPKEMTYSHQLSEVVSGEFIGYAPENPLCWVLDGQFDLSFWDDFCYWVDEYGWVDCVSQVVGNPDFTGNPVGSWTLGAVTQTGERTFQDSGGGPNYQVVFTQVIELPAGSHTLYYNFEIDGTPNWNGAFSLTNSDIPATTWLTSSNSQETGSISFTVSGSSTRTLSVTMDTFEINPTFTCYQLNIC